jgi:glycosyltransferase involved in cell wall biosynthesis
MRIAILGIKGVPGHHGVEVVVDSLIPHLIALGHEITVYGYRSYTQPMEDYHGARVKVVQGSSLKNFEMISHMLKASLDARREHYDIVHIHSTDPCLLAWIPKPKYGIVATSHGQAYLRKKWGWLARRMSMLAERSFFRCADVRTCVSKPLCEYYRGRFNRDVVYIPNGIKIRGNPNIEWLGKWGLEPAKYFFCSAGRIERTKGLDTLLGAYERMGNDMPLVVAGGGSASDFAYFDELKARKPKGVTFTGFLTGDELFSLYAYAGVFVFPSEYEAMSIALLEGMSFGVPTVYSDIPENEAVAGGFGYSFRVSDPESLAERLRHVLTHIDDARSLGEKMKTHVREHHSWPMIARRYDEVYRGLRNGEIPRGCRPSNE